MLVCTGFLKALPLVVALAGGAEPGVDDVASGEDVKAAGDKAGPPGGTSGAVQFNNAGAFGGDAANFFWDRKNKRLGIGTKTPARNLEIRDPVTPALSIGDGWGALELAVATASGFFSNVATRGDAVIRIPGGGGEDLILAVRNGNNGALRFTTGTTAAEAERMTITSAGNVGIGTTAPSEQLEITGNLGLPSSTGGAGVILSAGSRFIHSFGVDNTFVGRDAGNFSMNGYGNTGLGLNALAANTEGICNVAVGGETLQANEIGSNNTAVGHYALFTNISGDDNTATGTLALYTNVSGSRNTASGDNALVSNVEGHDNTADGVFALGSNNNGHWNTASGVNALRSNISGDFNTASGHAALYGNYGGHYNTAAGASALSHNIVGNYNTAIGAEADVAMASLTNATAIGSRAIVDDSNKVRIGDRAVTVIEGEVAYTYVSDLNQKENFRPVDGESVLRKIRGMQLRSWNYIGHDPRQFRHYGPVAQEFFAAFGQDEVGNSGTPTTINSGDEAGILMMAVQALEKRTAEVENLKAEIAELRRLVLAQAAQPHAP